MSAKTAIAWTDATWPVTAGCRRVSPGCEHCYAERLTATRLSSTPKYAGLATMTAKGPRFTGEVRPWPAHLDWPLKWRKGRRVFVGDMSDLFHDDVPDEFIAAVFGVAAACPQHVFQVLTKRPERMREWFRWLNDRGGLGSFIRTHSILGDRATPRFFNTVSRTEVVRGRVVRSMRDPWVAVFNAAACIGNGPLPNVHVGVSVEDQKRADERLPILREIPAALRFLSVEPLLSDILPICFDGIDWVIVGGESGPGARECRVGWISHIVSRAHHAGAAVFVKQTGSVLAREMGLRHKAGADPDEWPESLRQAWPQEFPEARR